MSQVKISKEKKQRIDAFEHGVIFSKLGIMAGLTALAYKQGDTAFISKNPSSFLSECILVGVSAAIPTLLFAYNRRDKKNGLDKSKTLSAMFVAFMLFFIFHVLMELSGMNNIDTQDTNTGDAKQQKYLHDHILTNTGKACVLLLGGVMVMLSLRTKDTHLFETQRWTFVGEMLFFGVANAIPFYKILRDRGHEKKGSVNKSLLMGAAFGLGYAGLEWGGFFTSIFNDLRIGNH